MPLAIPRALRVAVFAALSALTAGQAAATLVGNGGFETGPAMTPAGEVMVLPGATTLANWSVGGGGVLYVSDIYRAPSGAAPGVYFVRLVAEKHGGTVGVDCSRIGKVRFWASVAPLEE